MTLAARKSDSQLAGRLIANESKNNVVDFTTAFDSDKVLASLIGRFRKAGHEVYTGGDNDFFVTRWGLVRHCSDAASLRLFARQVGVLR